MSGTQFVYQVSSQREYRKQRAGSRNCFTSSWTLPIHKESEQRDDNSRDNGTHHKTKMPRDRQKTKKDQELCSKLKKELEMKQALLANTEHDKSMLKR